MLPSQAMTPDEYVELLSGWQREVVEALRAAVTAAGDFREEVKWGHLVYLLEGPAVLVRAEDERVLFGFWRGKRLRDVEPRLAGSGKYEMATLELREGDTLDPGVARRLASEAARLNRELGDPRDAARR